MSVYIKVANRMPVVSDFAAGDGSPLIIDSTTGIAYYLSNNVVFPIMGGVIIPPVTHSFSNGFSTGFA